MGKHISRYKTLHQIVQEELNRSVQRLQTIVDGGPGQMVTIDPGVGKRYYHQVTQEDIDRARQTLLDLKRPLTGEDMRQVRQRIVDQHQHRLDHGKADRNLRCAIRSTERDLARVSL